MNIVETRLLLTELWALYPSAPRLSEGEKQVAIMAWFRTLNEYSYEDVRKALKIVSSQNPRFIPSAFEVLNYCSETIDETSYLPPEYDALEAERGSGYSAKYSSNPYIEIGCLKSELEHAATDAERAEIQALIDLNVKVYHIDERLRSMRLEARNRALAAYHERETIRGAADFKQVVTFTYNAIEGG